MVVFNKKQQIIRCFYLLSRSKHFCPTVCENALNPKPISSHLYSSVYSNGSRSVRSNTVPIYPIYRSLIWVNEKIRSFSTFSSEFENASFNGSEDSVLESSRVDENVAKDDIFKENLSNNSSNVINVAKIPLSGFFDKDVEGDDSKLVYEIVEKIKNCKDGKLEKEVVRKDEKSPTRLVGDVFRVLNRRRVSGMPFFAWAKDENPELFHKADFRSLIIDNCGWLEDYGTMKHLLEGFSVHDFSLTEKSFGFFSGFGGDKDLTMASIRKVVNLLSQIGGSCRGTGLIGMIKSLCKMDLVEMAMFVIQITEKKFSFYNIIVHEMCMRSRFEEANDLLEEMSVYKCGPDVLSYNYILSALCKNGRTKEACDLFKEMENKGCKPDALMFEIIILHMCKLGKMDIASQYFGQMVIDGLIPRVNTYTALIKVYINSGKYEEAHEFVSKLGFEHRSCGSSAYNLLVSFSCQKKEYVTAGKLLIKMMDKRFIPQFTLYKNILIQLRKTDERELANDIKDMYYKLRA